MEIQKEHDPAPAVDEDATGKIGANEENISEPSYLNDGETGFNPTAAEMAGVFEGIKAQVKALGKKKKDIPS